MATNPRELIRRRHGFTVIEIMTVLVLVAVIASLAVPAMGGYVDKTRTQRALDQLVTDIAHARLLAVQQGRPVAVSLGGEASYTLDTLSIGGTWGTLKSVDLKLEYGAVSFVDTVTLEFSSRGLLVSDPGSGQIKIVLNDARDSIFVSPVGRLYRDY